MGNKTKTPKVLDTCHIFEAGQHIGIYRIRENGTKTVEFSIDFLSKLGLPMCGDEKKGIEVDGYGKLNVMVRPSPAMMSCGHFRSGK